MNISKGPETSAELITNAFQFAFEIKRALILYLALLPTKGICTFSYNMWQSYNKINRNTKVYIL